MLDVPVSCTLSVSKSQMNTPQKIPSINLLREKDGLYGTGILFEEPNPTGSSPRDLIGLY